MKHNKWSKGTLINVKRLGECTLSKRVIDGEFNQFKIKYGLTAVIGEPSYDNATALDNALYELKKRFKSILN